MITVEAAEQIIAEQIPTFDAEEVPLEAAHGQILRETVPADRDLPPFDRVTMDGIAIHSAAWLSGVRSYEIEATATAGVASPALADASGGCVQVMTGAMLPEGADTVIPYEDLEVRGDQASIRRDAQIAPLQNLHSRGSDRRQGESVLETGIVLRAPHISIAAAVGRSTLRIARRPAVAIVSTGDELVDVTDAVLPYQIRSANDHGIRAAFLNSGYHRVKRFRVADRLEDIQGLLDRLLNEYGLLILTGGVSMGKRDYVPIALDQLGVTNVFHKISQRPGKPMWFGLSRTAVPVFALPGNPVSTLVCLHRYVLPSLEQALGARQMPPPHVQLKHPVNFRPPLTGFMPVTLAPEADGRWAAAPLEYNTSGDFASLRESDGFVELPLGRHIFEAGDAVRYFSWK